MTMQHSDPTDLTDPTFPVPRGHHVFIDGPSIDGTLGRVIGHPPGPDTRPDWRRLEPFVKQVCGPLPYSATFVFWSPGQQGFMHFLQSSGFLIALGDRYVPGRSCADLIRERVARLNDAAEGEVEQEWQVIVGTHNEELIEDLPRLADRASRISVFGFTEFFPDRPELDAVVDFYDIEDDAQLFRTPLPRAEYEDEGSGLLEGGSEEGVQPELMGSEGLGLGDRPSFERLAGDGVRELYLIVALLL